MSVKKSKENYIYYLIVAMLICIPFSFEIGLGGAKINFPIEPLLAIIGIFLLFSIHLKKLWESTFSRHPITILALLYHLWMVIMIAFSSDILVSIKYTLVNLAHFWIFYFGYYNYSRYKDDGLQKWVIWYGVALFGVAIYFWYNFVKYDFRLDSVVVLARPFYTDNTIFSACLVLVSPFFFVGPSKSYSTSILKFLIGFLLMATIFTTYCRAAWISIILAASITLFIYILNIKFKQILWIFTTIIFCIGLLVPTIENTMEAIHTESKKGGWVDQSKSIGNLKTDVSNLERLNRYKCALRMFRDKPYTGFGPGTYQSAYLSYQKPEEMTRLSVVSVLAEDGRPHPSGRGGGAHSEYLQALSEMGFVGFAFWLAFVIISFFTAMRIYHRETNKHRKILSLTILFCLTSYFIHGLFNNFLHSEEVSVIFWPLLATLAIMDLPKKEL